MASKSACGRTSRPMPSRALPPAEYAQALERLHAGLRRLDVTTPHVMDRVAALQRDVASPDVTPDLGDADRALLTNTLHDLRQSIVSRRASEQLLHGEPHPWNVLDTKNGPLFIDFENTARGPVEYDIAWLPNEVGERYPNAGRGLGRRMPGRRLGDHRNTPLESRRPTPEREAIRIGVPRRSAGRPTVAGARRCRLVAPPLSIVTNGHRAKVIRLPGTRSVNRTGQMVIGPPRRTAASDPFRSRTACRCALRAGSDRSTRARS